MSASKEQNSTAMLHPGFNKYCQTLHATAQFLLPVRKYLRMATNAAS
jgi:hypothetical protein